MGDLIADPFRAARLLLTLRREGVTNPHLLKLMEATDRSAFAGQEFAELAFEDTFLPLPCGQAILPPLVTAQILDAAGMRSGHTGRVLLVGGGGGYMAALASPLCEHLVVAERYRRLAHETGARLEEMGYLNVATRHADGLTGLQQDGPYDRILLTGQVDSMPHELVDALTPAGFIIAPGTDGERGLLRLVGQQGETARRALAWPLQPLATGVSASL